MESEYFETGRTSKTEVVDEKEMVRGKPAPNQVVEETFRSLKIEKNGIGRG